MTRTIRRVHMHERGDAMIRQFEDLPCDVYARDLRIAYGAGR